MQPRMLGKTSIQVSPIGLGTVKFGRNEAVKYPSHFEIPTDEEARSLLCFAKQLGVNVLDTAPAYGMSEERLGKLLPPKERKDWVIVTKIGEEFIQGESQYNFTPEHARFSIERSLKRLNTDFIDVMLVHSDGNDVYNIQHFGILECLSDLKQMGLIRATGMSTKTVEGGLLALDHSDIVMVTYNPLETGERSVIRRAHELQKGILIKKALASGHIDKIKAMDSGASLDPVSYSLNFILQEPGVSSVIIGTLKQKHLQAVVEIASTI